MQQKMLSDQQGKACATGQKEAEKKFIKDGPRVLGLCLCNFFEQSFGGLVRWHADLSLRLHFYASWFKKINDCDSTILPVGFAID
jgi:hypothetical protein